MFSLVQDAETGLRGYIITGAERYLDPYRKASTRRATSQALASFAGQAESA